MSQPANILELMRQLLVSMDITDYEPAVPHMLVELFYRHVSDVLEESRRTCELRKSKEIGEEDLNVAIKHSMRRPATPEHLQMIAKKINSQPLPPIPDIPEIVLPSEENSLMQPNFQLSQGSRP